VVQTFATTSGLALQNGDNRFGAAGANGAGVLEVSTKTSPAVETANDTKYASPRFVL
jgi:hypothetical protein